MSYKMNFRIARPDTFELLNWFAEDVNNERFTDMGPINKALLKNAVSWTIDYDTERDTVVIYTYEEDPAAEHDHKIELSNSNSFGGFLEDLYCFDYNKLERMSDNFDNVFGTDISTFRNRFDEKGNFIREEESIFNQLMREKGVNGRIVETDDYILIIKEKAKGFRF